MRPIACKHPGLIVAQFVQEQGEDAEFSRILGKRCLQSSPFNAIWDLNDTVSLISKVQMQAVAAAVVQ